MNRRAVEDELRGVRAPRESASEETAWPVVRATYAALPATAPPRRAARRPAVALALAAASLALLLALTPAGATVRRWLTGTPGVPHARPALLSLPAPGTILVSGPGGTWTVDAGGLRRRLGPWRAATWSPHALYVAAVGANSLSAVDRRGVSRWSLSRPAVAQPRWFAPDGYRVAYLSGSMLRVVAGDGTLDRPLARAVRSVAPAWQPAHPYDLAYAAPGGRIVIRDADSGRVLWSRIAPAGLRQLTWSSTGTRLLAVGRLTAVAFDARGDTVARFAPGQPLQAGAISPDGRLVALLSRERAVVTLLNGTGVGRTFTGTGLRGLAFSPDSRWLLVGWPAADQWVFVRVVGRPRIIAVSRIAEQFGGRHALPTIEGWCCAAGGGAG